MNNSRNLNFEPGGASHNFKLMKRVFTGIMLGSFLALGTGRAADAVTLAAQQEAEERAKRLSATIDEIQAAQLAQQKQISALASELSKLREEVARNNNNSAHQESISKLSDQILKVDRSRIADNERVKETMAQLGKAIRDMPSAPPTRHAPNPEPVNPRPPAGGNNGGGATTEDFYPYVVVSGDSLSKIVAKCRKEKIMVTSQQVKDANPTVDWESLKIGKTILIPKLK